MKKQAIMFILLVSSIFLIGCASGYKEFYTSTVPPKYVATLNSNPNLVLLKKGEEPKLYYSKNLNQDKRHLVRDGYSMLGYSSFNGKYEKESAVIEHAKDIGALVILLKTKYTNTETHSGVLYLPTTQTTYHSGNVYGGGGSAYYSGTSTTYGTSATAYSNTVRRYDQEALFFIKNNMPSVFDIELVKNKSRNSIIDVGSTGPIIDIIKRRGPVYKSKVMEGDILLKVDGTHTPDKSTAIRILKSYDTSKAHSIWTVYRDGKTLDIKVLL